VKSKDLEKQESVLWLQADIETLTEDNRKLSNQLRIAKADINALTKINDDLSYQMKVSSDKEESQ